MKNIPKKLTRSVLYHAIFYLQYTLGNYYFLSNKYKHAAPEIAFCVYLDSIITQLLYYYIILLPWAN